ncbi:transcriptional regulator FilR1 domain-containing protein [Methanolobus sp.]|uniref:transcriptional regulator FilR1 domain-containing protein n=1 Tax=Methanolobus sp. TaxID=1874737 RepID=UPI00260004EC|nr:transcriptional regulator FilR1 domain-containing protein [Methanolobus sp.]
MQCDTCISLRPLINDSTVDNIRLVNTNPEVIQWGRELLEYYLKDSTPITEL